MHVRMMGEEYDLAGLRNACEHSERSLSAPVVEVEQKVVSDEWDQFAPGIVFLDNRQT
jgi:hypothetical protein